MADYLITTYGAEPGTDACQAGAVQRAIDAASANGGGRVVIPPDGPFVVGTLDLKPGVELHLPRDARLLGSPRRSDYREEVVAGEYGAGQSGFLIRTRNADNVAITGDGVIDQQGSVFADGYASEDGPYARRWKSWRPRMLGFYGGAAVRLQGVTLQNTANWCVHLLGCEDVEVDGVTIRTPLDGPNCDGICLDHCVGARIRNCDIASGDDSIVIKTTAEGRRLGYDGTRDLEVSDCRLLSTSSAIKIGSESQSDFRDLRFRDCSIASSARGLGIQLRDGGDVSDVVFSNIDVETRLFHDQWWGKAEPIYITAVPRHEGHPVGVVRGVRFEQIRARSEAGVLVVAAEERGVRDLTLSDIDLRIEKTSKWPGGWRDLRPSLGGEQGGLSRSTTSAVYLERVDNVLLDGVRVAWGGELSDDYRHALEARASYAVNDDGLVGESARPDKYPARLSTPSAPDDASPSGVHDGD